MNETRPDPGRWATWRSIHAQPGIWRAWADAFRAAEVRDWIAGQAAPETWFCGAGSCACLGEIVVAGLEGRAGPLRAVASTDLVSRPHAHLEGRAPLVVSFGRSGSSPETLATLDALDALAPRAPRLNLTCDPQGALARRGAPGPCGVVLLPAAARDTGLAMTASFTTMLLTALALFDPAPPADPLPALAGALDRLLPDFAAAARDAPTPSRLVFVGSGPMAFAAREAALKVMQLTAGRIPALWDSTLGLRHGSGAFIDAGTAIVMFTSGEPQAARYEGDLLDELSVRHPGQGLATVGPAAQFDPRLDLPDMWQAPLAIAFAQVLAVTLADRMGLDADAALRGSGAPDRAAGGVTLYPVRG